MQPLSQGSAEGPILVLLGSRVKSLSFWRKLLIVKGWGASCVCLRAAPTGEGCGVQPLWKGCAGKKPPGLGWLVVVGWSANPKITCRPEYLSVLFTCRICKPVQAGFYSRGICHVVSMQFLRHQICFAGTYPRRGSILQVATISFQAFADAKQQQTAAMQSGDCKSHVWGC